jgi:hypothetical protein
MKFNNRLEQTIDNFKAALETYRTFGFLRRKAFYWKWFIEGYTGRSVSLNMSQKATVIIPSYHIKRARNVEPLIRTILRCDFVEKIIVSNNNPQIRIEDWVKINDVRVVLINQVTRRGCGYGYVVASKENAEYSIIIDDDLLIYPEQLAILFQRLIDHPEVPHGVAGRDYRGQYIHRQETDVEVLFLIYAVTKAHVQKYFEFVTEITANKYASYESIEFWGDDIIISHVGTQKPIIHDVGFILQCQTYNARGVAIHLEEEFERQRMDVRNALRKLNYIARNHVPVSH